jgi:hypothetical protein
MEKTCQDCYSFWEEDCKGKEEVCDKWKSVDDPTGEKAEQKRIKIGKKLKEIEEKKKKIREKVFTTPETVKNEKLDKSNKLTLLDEPPPKKKFSLPIEDIEPVLVTELPLNNLNREAWLTQAIDLLRTKFKKLGYTIPEKIHVSCGWPGCGSIKNRVGECWDKANSKAGICEIFISPRLDDTINPTLGVLPTLVHELGHAILGHDVSHKKPFKKYMETVGLEGKVRSTYASEALIEMLKSIVNEIGPYPHNGMNIKNKEAKKQATRLIKANCPTCDYIIRVTRKHMNEKGLPICPVCKIPFVSDQQSNEIKED